MQMLNGRNATVTIQVFALNLAKKAHELKVEKKKADKLLIQMLPPTVAMSLQQKKKVNAESFGSVTIYFRNFPFICCLFCSHFLFLSSHALLRVYAHAKMSQFHYAIFRLFLLRETIYV